MKKSLIALAVAGAFAAPAFAATSNVDISGKVAMDVTFVSGTGGAGTNNTHQVNNDNSVVTIAGSEDMGGGMKAFFSLTYGLPMTNGGALAGQNQIVGLEGGFGKVFLGAFDNPLKVLGRGIDLFADQSTGDLRYMTGAGAMEARANDVMAYLSPVMSGFQVVAAHTNKPLGTVATKGGNNTHMNIFKLAYANGPLSLGLGYHTVDTTGTTALQTQDESAWRFVGSYKVGDLKVTGNWGNVKNAYNAADNAVGEKVSTWGLGLAYGMGPITLKTQYEKANDKVAAADGSMWALGMDYAMSKRTTAQLAYSKVSNQAAASYGCNAAVANTDALTCAVGADPSRVSVGLKHTF